MRRPNYNPRVRYIGAGGAQGGTQGTQGGTQLNSGTASGGGGASAYFDIINENTPIPALVWSGILIVLVTLIVVVATVPDYQGTRTVNGPTRTYPPTSTTTTTLLTTTTVAPTTTPTPALVLTCPTSDVSVPLGFPLNNVALGGVTLTGGCAPLSLTYVDTLVGTIAKKKDLAPTAFGGGNSDKIPPAAFGGGVGDGVGDGNSKKPHGITPAARGGGGGNTLLASKGAIRIGPPLLKDSPTAGGGGNSNKLHEVTFAAKTISHLGAVTSVPNLHFFNAEIGKRCGVPQGAKGKKRSTEEVLDFHSRTDLKSPSYPNGQLRMPATLVTANSNAAQPNPALETNINYVVSAVDSELFGATIRVYTKALLELSGSPFTLSSLAPLNTTCSNTGAGQAQVMYDAFADIWLFLEPSTSNVTTTLCLYASNGAQPLTSSYTLYELTFPALDVPGGPLIGYPKLANFNGYYTVSFVYNRTSPVLVIVDRAAIVAQQLSTSYFVVPPALPNIPTMANTTWSPLDNRAQVNGGSPNAWAGGVVPQNLSTGVYFMRQRDTLGPQDYLDVIEYDAINFGTGTANASSYSIPILNFDSSGASYCIPVPLSNTTKLYAAQEWLGGRLSFNVLAPPYVAQYRVVGTFVTQACTGARVQWFELEFNFATRQWILRQEGLTPILPGAYLWMPAIAEDKYGNILLAFSNSSASDLAYFPSLGAYSRVADDPLNSLRTAAGPFVWAAGSAPGPLSSAWGYSSVAIADPAPPVGRTFYTMGSYSPPAANVWQGFTAQLVMQGDIVQRNVLGEDYCGQTQTCEFFILDGNV